MKVAHFIFISIFASSAAVQHGSAINELSNELEELKNELDGMMDEVEERNGGKTNCGGHTASSCTSCPWSLDGKTWIGEVWCNGDCKWLWGRGCVDKSSMYTWCGGHEASSCAKCPWSTNGKLYGGENWCNGDCQWLEDRHWLKGECVTKSYASWYLRWSQVYSGWGN